MFETLAQCSLVLALIPALLAACNLMLYRPPPGPDPTRRAPVSLLIPARDEEGQIEGALKAALASEGVEMEVVVLDDHSSDRTRMIADALAQTDERLRVVASPSLPAGWSGKQHACHILAREARHPLMVFVDADVRLAPDALGRIASFMDTRQVGLASGFPRQETGTFLEKLLIPLIHFLLLGFLPMLGLRYTRQVGFGAGCGQLLAVRREAYERAGGHAAISTSLHDGVMLPRAFRRSGVATDLFDASRLATCRMYRSASEVWAGLSKNATEGMATPAGLPVWTALLFGGQVLPFLLMPWGILSGAPGGALAMSAGALACAWLTRFALTLRFGLSPLGAWLHPLGILALLALQWMALINHSRGQPAVWRDRAYSR